MVYNVSFVHGQIMQCPSKTKNHTILKVFFIFIYVISCKVRNPKIILFLSVQFPKTPILGLHPRNETAMLVYKNNKKWPHKFSIIIESSSQKTFYCIVQTPTWPPWRHSKPSTAGFYVTSSPPCWWTKTKDFSLAPSMLSVSLEIDNDGYENALTKQ